VRVLLKGTKDQIQEACTVLAKRRARTDSTNERNRKNEKNRRESALMRAAYLVSKADPSRQVQTDAFASAINGKRSEALIDAAIAITQQRAVSK